MMIVFLWLLDPGPAVITAEAYRQLRQQHLVKSLTVIGMGGEDDWIEGEVTTLDSPVVRNVGLTKRAFTLRVRDASEPNLAGNVGAGGLGITHSSGGVALWAPHWWQALIMLGVPVAVAVVIGRILSPVRLLIGKD